MTAMAPLDNSEADHALAGIVGRSGRGKIEPPSLVPERRAVKWAEVLAVIAAEIEQRQGAQRAERQLRSVGARMNRDVLLPLPKTAAELESALNRALSDLDWGWVAVVERDGGSVLEHRAPWPFQKNAEQLRFVLEGFYTETARRLAPEPAKAARLVGMRGSALVFQWVLTGASASTAPPAAGTPAQPAATPSDEPRVPGRSPAEMFAALDEMRNRGEPPTPAASKPAIAETPVLAAPKREDRLVLRDEHPLPVLPMAFGPMAAGRRERVTAKSQAMAAPVVLIAAAVFTMLFALGLVSSKGDLPGDLLRGLMRYSGVEGESNGSLARLEKSALNGDMDAQIQLGLRLADRRAPEHDDARAASWFRMAANAGSAEAQYDLGVMTDHGLGLKADDVEAAILYMNAAANGFPMAQYRIGAAYENGRGVSRSASDAATWYERAARQGVREAESSLARLYAAGNGVAADLALAYAWSQLAEQSGDHDAATLRATLVTRMTPEQVAAARQQADGLFAEIGRAAPVSARPPIDRVIDRQG
jgi:TPR repeat protein